MKQRFYIDGVEVNEPNNYALNEIELNFDKGDVNAQVSIDTWELGVGDKRNTNDAEIIVRKHLAGGLTGGVGVGEGKPLAIYLEKNGAQLQLFNGYLDLWTAQYECGKITAKAVEQGKIDWLKSGVADFSFEYLASINLITEANYILVPYVISTVPNYRETFMATITIFVITGSLVEQVQWFIDILPNAGNPFTASSIISIITHIIYVATLLIALIKLLIDVYNLIIQPIKYHAVMYVNELLRIGAAHLGLTFASTFLQSAPLNKLAILPQKFQTQTNDETTSEGKVKGLFIKDKTGQKGFPSQGYTFGDLIRDVQLMFNAKLIIDGGYLRIEKQNYNQSSSLFQVPTVDNNGAFQLNEADFNANFVLQFQTDLNDRNTIQEYLGTIYQVELLPRAITNRQMVLTKRLQTISINYALAKRKTELTLPEKIFDVFFKVTGAIIDALIVAINAIITVINVVIKTLNKIIKALGKVGIKLKFEIKTITPLNPQGFSDLIEDRIGMMKMETDFVYTPKMLLVGNNSDARNNVLEADNETTLSAKYLWENFHYLKSFVGQSDNPLGNQYYLYSVDKMPFCYDDYLKVRTNNKIIDSDGASVGVIDSLKWNIDEQQAQINYRIQRTYTNNLIEVKLEPNGV